MLALVTGFYTMYGGESTVVFGAFIQFLLIFIAGAVLMWLAYLRMPGGLRVSLNNPFFSIGVRFTGLLDGARKIS